jgi:hypothetical protein
MMNGRGKSDPVVVAVKAVNKVEPGSVSAAEPLEPRAGTEGNADQLRPSRLSSADTGSDEHGPASGNNPIPQPALFAHLLGRPIASDLLIAALNETRLAPVASRRDVVRQTGHDDAS